MSMYILAATFSLFDILKYLLCMVIVFNVPMYKKKQFIPIWIIVSLAICTVLFGFYGFNSYFYLMPNVCSILLFFGIERKSRLKGILYIALSWIIMDSLAELLKLLLSAISGHHDYLLGVISVHMITIKIISLTILVLYHIVVNVLIRKRVTYVFYSYQWGIIFLSFVGILLIVPTLEKIAQNEQIETRQYISMGISIMMVLFLFIVVMIWQSYVVRKNMVMQEREISYQYMMKSQSDYFNNLMKNDEEIRKLRHDMRAHITALKELAGNGHDVDGQMMEYLSRMEEKTNATKTKRYTGNKAVDAVINELTHQMDKEGIAFKFDGILRVRDDVKDFDLCTIFYNTIQNAIEGCEKVEGAERSISVKVKNIGDKLGISVKNNTVLKKLPDSGVLITTKNDKVNHGLGTKNVKEVVNRYEGIYDNAIENGNFVVDIII